MNFLYDLVDSFLFTDYTTPYNLKPNQSAVQQLQIKC